MLQVIFQSCCKQEWSTIQAKHHSAHSVDLHLLGSSILPPQKFLIISVLFGHTNHEKSFSDISHSADSLFSKPKKNRWNQLQFVRSFFQTLIKGWTLANFARG